jgi:acyl-CoA thioesterase-1
MLTVGMAVIAIAVLGLVWLIYLAFIRRPVGSLHAMKTRGRARGTKTLVVCAGDSLTHASLSSDYVARLRERHRSEEYEFVNAGQNGDTSATLLSRMQDVIALQPGLVTVLIGTNDARVLGGTPDALEAYRANLRAILAGLREHTHAALAILSIPPLGEDVGSTMNRALGEYCRVIAETAAETRAAYLPLGERLSDLIVRFAGADHDRRPFRVAPALLMGAAFRHFVLRQTWDQIAARRGLIVTTDRIHLSDRSANVLADLYSARNELRLFRSRRI